MKPQQSAAARSTGLSFTSRSFGKVNVLTSEYQRGGKLAVELVAENGEDIATLSVNMPEFSKLLGEGEFFAKTWSENGEIAADALASGIFRDTGRTSGDIVNAPIWTLR
jgi:hypothetical protein